MPAPKFLVLLTFSSTLGAFFFFNLGPNAGTLFLLDLKETRFLDFVFLDGGADFGFDFLRGFFEFALSLAEAAGEFGDLGTTKKKDSNDDNGPDNGTIENS